MQTWDERKRAGNITHAPDNGHSTGVGMAANPLGKLPGSVWTIATQPLTVPDHLGISHFAAFRSSSPAASSAAAPTGGVVLDPFGGTSTAALIAYTEGCHGISNDLSADYCRLAKWRTTDPSSGQWPPDSTPPKSRPTSKGR